MKTIFLFAMLALAMPARAADPSILPTKPEPRPAAETRGAGKEFWLQAGAMGAAWTLDAVSTHDAFAANPTRNEVGGLVDGSRSVGKVMGAWAAVDIAAAVTAYEWKRHVHNRILNPLWRVPMAFRVEGHLSGAVANWKLPASAASKMSANAPILSAPTPRGPTNIEHQ